LERLVETLVVKLGTLPLVQLLLRLRLLLLLLRMLLLLL
jgi:hypothetical protein